jgi:hypothetical protein
VAWPSGRDDLPSSFTVLPPGTPVSFAPEETGKHIAISLGCGGL